MRVDKAYLLGKINEQTTRQTRLSGGMNLSSEELERNKKQPARTIQSSPYDRFSYSTLYSGDLYDRYAAFGTNKLFNIDPKTGSLTVAVSPEQRGVPEDESQPKSGVDAIIHSIEMNRKREEMSRKRAQMELIDYVERTNKNRSLGARTVPERSIEALRVYRPDTNKMSQQRILVPERQRPILNAQNQSVSPSIWNPLLPS